MTQRHLTEFHFLPEEALPLRAKPLTVTAASGLERQAETKSFVPPSATSTEGPTAVRETSSGSNAQEDQVLAEVAGLVLNEAGDSLLVRLEEQNITVHFPRGLLSADLAIPGSAVTYQIVCRPDGIRYQRFVARLPRVDEELVRNVHDELSKIRLRGK